jgi:hypothetical protein
VPSSVLRDGEDLDAATIVRGLRLADVGVLLAAVVAGFVLLSI